MSQSKFAAVCRRTIVDSRLLAEWPAIATISAAVTVYLTEIWFASAAYSHGLTLPT
jgi:hypothetical protein